MLSYYTVTPTTHSARRRKRVEYKLLYSPSDYFVFFFHRDTLPSIDIVLLVSCRVLFIELSHTYSLFAYYYSVPITHSTLCFARFVTFASKIYTASMHRVLCARCYRILLFATKRLLSASIIRASRRIKRQYGPDYCLY